MEQERLEEKEARKEYESMPVNKVQRASKFVSTGVKIGGNYLKHYAKKLVNSETTRDQLHEDNARDIYKSLSQLKGSALKVAQMLSMDKNLLPTAYQQQFAMAQYSAPPLSYPLVARTFQKFFGKSPDQIFDTFSRNASNAASMGQVHQATLNGKKLAVKIQYPGIAESIRSDLAMVKPIALSMFKINPPEYEEYIQEVELRMMEETDYDLELKRSMEISKETRHIPNLAFSDYYPELSCGKILVMDWMEGKPLGDVKTESLPGETNQLLGQALWDFYDFQIHQLKAAHADPHPGNFIITPDYKLGIIDFGCVKVIPEDFYKTYFQLLDPALLKDPARLNEVFFQLRFIHPEDSAEEKELFTSVFTKLVELLGRPFASPEFDFGNDTYFEELYRFGEEASALKPFRESKKVRGVRDALYINRTYFGLYNMLHGLKAKVKTGKF